MEPKLPSISMLGSLPTPPMHERLPGVLPDPHLWDLFHQFQKKRNEPRSSEEVLAEKKRRNAGASARFRDRRKQREKELVEKCHQIELRAKKLEEALAQVEASHPLLRTETEQPSLVDRVGQLEQLMVQFRHDKASDAQKLEDLEKENKYLRSLLVRSPPPL